LLRLFTPKVVKKSRVFYIFDSVMTLTSRLFLRIAAVEAGKAAADSADAYHKTTRGKSRPKPEEQAKPPTMQLCRAQ
jgi:hypothetical protein